MKYSKAEIQENFYKINVMRFEAQKLSFFNSMRQLSRANVGTGLINNSPILRVNGNRNPGIRPFGS